MTAPAKPSLADLARLGEPDVAPKEATPEAPPMERDHAFVAKVFRSDGESREATVVSRIPDVEDRVKIGRLRARLAGVPWDLLDPETRLLIDAQAVLAILLDFAALPAWFVSELGENVEVLLAVYQEVTRHEREFFRRFSEASGAGQGAAVVQIVPVPGAAMPPESIRWENQSVLGAVGRGRGGPSGAAG